jgi:Lon protease-like protein
MSDESPLAGFNGIARLFPLPNLVLFPNVMQPLHIFEPRYRQMTADALAGDRFIALVLLQAGWEKDYAGTPAVSPVACLGKIIAEQRLDDGRFNILLRGQCRVHIDQEIPEKKPWRQARVHVLEEVDAPDLQAQRKLRRQLVRCVPSWLSSYQAVADIRKLLKSELPLSVLGDILTFALPLDTSFKQQMLEELSMERRLRALLRYLQDGEAPAAMAAAKVERTFPPEFSVN